MLYHDDYSNASSPIIPNFNADVLRSKVRINSTTSIIHKRNSNLVQRRRTRELVTDEHAKVGVALDITERIEPGHNLLEEGDLLVIRP